GLALHRLGWRVLALDLDRQNALRLNFELPDSLPGIADGYEKDYDWNDLAVETPAGIHLLPFGSGSPGDALRFNDFLVQNSGWLRRRLEPFAGQRDLLVIADMPAGPSLLDSEIAPLADLQLLALLADAMSLALLPRLQRGDFLPA